MRVEKPSHVLNNYLFNNNISYEKKENHEKKENKQKEDFDEIFKNELAKLRK